MLRVGSVYVTRCTSYTKTSKRAFESRHYLQTGPQVWTPCPTGLASSLQSEKESMNMIERRRMKYYIYAQTFWFSPGKKEQHHRASSIYSSSCTYYNSVNWWRQCCYINNKGCVGHGTHSQWLGLDIFEQSIYSEWMKTHFGFLEEVLLGDVSYGIQVRTNVLFGHNYSLSSGGRLLIWQWSNNKTVVN